jgi:hypothetical protein
MRLPRTFCWTKFGTEAGEGIAGIIRRKELERESNGGVFLWGVGNAIGPSVEMLLLKNQRPVVVFSPILSKPRAIDVAPERTVAWGGGVGLDGQAIEWPEHSIVTSRASKSGKHRSHYALVCHSESSLQISEEVGERFQMSQVRNLKSGKRVGASQVTSVVERFSKKVDLSKSSYFAAMQVELYPPYFVKLTNPREISKAFFVEEPSLVVAEKKYSA